MEELLKKLQSDHGLSSEQSKGILGTITGFIKEKFPMVSGAIDNMFQSEPAASTDTVSPAAGATAAGVTNPTAESGVLDKISDIVPGATGQKIEDFAKDKLGGLFGSNKA